jgi:hypothetical protein
MPESVLRPEGCLSRCSSPRDAWSRCSGPRDASNSSHAGRPCGPGVSHGWPCSCGGPRKHASHSNQTLEGTGTAAPSNPATDAACRRRRPPSPAGAKLLWGGKPLQGHTIPACYGAIEPTAVFVPLAALADPAHFAAATTEVFGPFQVVSEYSGAVRSGGMASPCVPRWLGPFQVVSTCSVSGMTPPGVGRGVSGDMAGLHRVAHAWKEDAAPLTDHPPAPGVCADKQLPDVLDALERMHHHLTAAVVSNDVPFLQQVGERSQPGASTGAGSARATRPCFLGGRVLLLGWGRCASKQAVSACG